MICPVNIQLIDFIAILQLLAGLCLLFFYEDLLKRVTVTPARKGCIDNLDQVSNYLQAEFANEDLAGIYGILDCKRENGEFITIPNLRNAISYSGKLAFVFILALMAVASHETKHGTICYGWLFVSSIIFLCLVGWSLLHRKDKIYDKYWNFRVSGAILCGIIMLTAFVPFEMMSDKTWITYSILTSIPAGMLIIVIFFKFDEWRAERLNQDLETLRNSVATFRNWAVSPNDISRYFGIEPTLRNLFRYDSSQTIAQKVVENYVGQRVHALKETYSGYNIVIYNPGRIVKARMRNELAAPRILVAKMFIALIAVIYLIVIIQSYRTF